MKIHDGFENIPCYAHEDFYPNIRRIFIILLTLPVTNLCCERSNQFYKLLIHVNIVSVCLDESLLFIVPNRKGRTNYHNGDESTPQRIFISLIYCLQITISMLIFFTQYIPFANLSCIDERMVKLNLRGMDERMAKLNLSCMDERMVKINLRGMDERMFKLNLRGMDDRMVKLNFRGMDDGMVRLVEFLTTTPHYCCE